MSFKSIPSLSLLVLLCLVVPAVHAGESVEDAAQSAAAKWLSLVDSGNYSASWKEAAAYFRGSVPEATWQAQVGAVRGPLGKVLGRALKARQYAKSLPGAPDGEYVVIQYDTKFEHKQAAIETVTPMKDRDGVWRVSGYYIR